MRQYVSQSQFRSALFVHGERTAVSNALSLAETVVINVGMHRYIIIIFILGAVGCKVTQRLEMFDLKSTELKIGDIYTVEPIILFELPDWTLSQESHSQLDSIATFILKHPNIVFEIGTHSDARASNSGGISITMKKSIQIADYLISKGVNRDQLTPKGYRNFYPLISDEEVSKLQTEMEKELAYAKNRRTEFKVIEIENTNHNNH